MKEKRKNIFSRIKDWWNELSQVDQAYLKGSLIGGISAAVGAAVTSNYLYSKKEAANAVLTDELCVEAYNRGLKDGEMKGYYNLLVRPEHAFKKMDTKDIEIGHF